MKRWLIPWKKIVRKKKINHLTPSQPQSNSTTTKASQNPSLTQSQAASRLSRKPWRTATSHSSAATRSQMQSVAHSTWIGSSRPTTRNSTDLAIKHKQLTTLKSWSSKRPSLSFQRCRIWQEKLWVEIRIRILRACRSRIWATSKKTWMSNRLWGWIKIRLSQILDTRFTSTNRRR